jgi:hypothetical protein
MTVKERLAEANKRIANIKNVYAENQKADQHGMESQRRPLPTPDLIAALEHLSEAIAHLHSTLLPLE